MAFLLEKDFGKDQVYSVIISKNVTLKTGGTSIEVELVLEILQ